MNDTMKFVTVGAIIVALYLLLRGTKAGIVSCVPSIPGPVNVISGQPMESMNCAIPLAADYLPLGVRCFVHVPATSQLGQRAALLLPLDTQTGLGASTYNASSGLPYGICGTVPYQTSGTKPVCNGNLCCVFADASAAL